MSSKQHFIAICFLVGLVPQLKAQQYLDTLTVFNDQTGEVVTSIFRVFPNEFETVYDTIVSIDPQTYNSTTRVEEHKILKTELISETSQDVPTVEKVDTLIIIDPKTNKEEIKIIKRKERKQ